ncbi:MAG: hypothetical protein A2Y84_00635 [Candidatus Colwellbacteria bacterium RBG_13_48_8]|uniref:Methyltransferase type 11 domain-containing protein n=1 Tax=Candidatus Colwellbacteria bacterium RBG_13_48_8 TaxID=1797685 RepID=A0A1G1YX56_9BACT|nr:MAG: hypothetical protein A2Y84_00635 [Candidatus Colwellbacteria bacterium RBG_13_48_8]
MLKSIKRYYYKVFWPYERYLEREVGDSRTLLDLGCGYPSPIKSFSSHLHSTGVDIFGPSIDKSRAERIHDVYKKMNILDAGREFKKKSFECVLASDVIEHLAKEDGGKLIEIMESLAAKKVIIFTPNGFLYQSAHDGNEYQKHLSGWSVKEMRDRGYRVIGINGWKPLRKEFAQIRFRPAFLWTLISNLTQVFIRSFPEQAFAILCVKELS